jgi:type IV pilus assembly protein PilW
LVIQYKTSVNATNCEGMNVAAGSYVIQRYFIQDGALRCDAGSYPEKAPEKEEGEETAPVYAISDYGSVSQVIIPNVDYMRILLGVSDDDSDGLTQKNYRYVDIDTYLKSEDESGNPLVKPRVRSIQIGLLISSADQLTSDSNVKTRNEKTFQVLDKTVTLAEPDNHLRQVITQTIALRNGFGARGSM